MFGGKKKPTNYFYIGKKTTYLCYNNNIIALFGYIILYLKTYRVLNLIRITKFNDKNAARTPVILISIQNYVFYLLCDSFLFFYEII